MEKLLSSLLYTHTILDINSEDLHLQLLSHQEYPSLKSVTDTLDYFSLENIAANVPKDAIYQLPFAFLALVKKKEEVELVLVKRIKEKITLTYQDSTKEKHTISSFKSLWNGTIIAIEPEEKGKRKILKKINFTTLILISIAIFSIINVSITSFSLLNILYTITTLLGLITSYYIKKEELGIKDQITSKVCGVISKSTDSCNTVINSKQGKIIGRVGLADISVLFFTSIFFVTQFLGFQISALYIVAILSLPIIAVSYYLQAFKLKHWCSLCLILSAILISQFVILQIAWTNWDFSFNYIAVINIVTILSVLWYTINIYWKDSVLLKTTLKEFYRFKRNKKFFLQSLHDNALYKVEDISESMSISFGANEPKITIHAITNPLCGFCKESFQMYAELLKKHSKDIQINFIFNVPLNEDNKSNQIASILIDIYQKNKTEAFTALEHWFKYRDIETWQSMYGISPMLFKLPKAIIQTHTEWCATNNLTYTPETIVNGYVFPKNEYEIEDLQFFIEDLKEKQTPVTKHIITL